MAKTKFISAVCTPLHADETLHLEGLEAHIHDQFENGISGLLVAGTMGKLQLLTDKTYLALVEHSVRPARGRGEVLVGVGDMRFSRTRDRILAVERYDIDGVVVVSPFFIKFSREELGDYFRAQIWVRFGRDD